MSMESRVFALESNMKVLTGVMVSEAGRYMLQNHLRLGGVIMICLGSWAIVTGLRRLWRGK